MRKTKLGLLAMAAIAAVAMLTACERSPVSTSVTNNPEVPVSYLFEHEGCRVYRFHDGGYRHYFVNCGGTASTSSLSSRPCGKSTCQQVNSIHTRHTHD